MKPLRHVMILASAGSGKTYALTSRFVELLARGAPPDRVVALTFTRKAAGEFFDEILNKLARAATDSGAAAALARDIGAPHLGRTDFLQLLRRVADAMHRLRLGTLDGFFSRIARMFPLELGLAGDFELLEEHAARLERQRVLRRMFTRTGALDAAQTEFLEAFKRATFGAEEKQLGRKLDAFLDAHQERYLEAPTEELWGDASRVWPEGSAWLGGEVDLAAAVRELRGWVQASGLAEKQRQRWEAFVSSLDEWSPGLLPARPVAYVLEKVLARWPEVVAGTAVLEFDRKKQPLDRTACLALAGITRHVVGAELVRRLITTRGIHAVVRGYERVYHDVVRRAGKLTFGDVQRLLQPGGEVGPLSRTADAPGRLFLDFRLDAQIDHWLLDEFQDTSRGQWSVLQNLIDEVIQDPAGARSFFCVGDVKQAIFAWREGDWRLFREIFQRYNAVVPGAIEERHLVESWRSGPSLLKLVNTVFGGAAAISSLFPPAAADNWNVGWRDHASAVPERNGQAALLLAEDEADRWKRTLDLLQEIRPLERGLTCAVLVLKNSIAAELADYLRREGGIPAVAESDLHVCTDNPLGGALLALLHAAAHPGDTMAWEHVQMSPLGAVLTAAGISQRETASRRLLAQVHAVGFERTIDQWLEKLEPHLRPDDVFSRLRARQFAAAAARFDRTGSRNVAEFVSFMERHVVRDPESAAVVRVMTVHKSKGLGFDVVIAPCLEGRSLDERRDGLGVQRAGDRSVAWVLDLPPKLFCEADTVLARHVREAEADACYEALSLLYVALTRAKRAMYLVIEAPGDSASRNYPRLLTATLGEVDRDVEIGTLKVRGFWAEGDPRWFAVMGARETSAASMTEPSIGQVSPLQSARRRGAWIPSGRKERFGRAAQAFVLDGGKAREFGATVHRLLAEVEWLEDGAVERAAEAWRARGESLAAVEEAVACLQASALAPVWERPSPTASVWRERAFDVVLGEAWVSGVFDRVVLERDAAGSVAAVTVFDFKTDRHATSAGEDGAVAQHREQLEVYRQAAAQLTALPVFRVNVELVLTRGRRRVPVAPAVVQIPPLQG